MNPCPHPRRLALLAGPKTYLIMKARRIQSPGFFISIYQFCPVNLPLKGKEFTGK
jgi:hypothetical protein